MFVLKQVHRWLGLAVCLFLIGQGLSGATLVWKDSWVTALTPEAQTQVVETPQAFAAAAESAIRMPGAQAIELAHPGLALNYVFFVPGGPGVYVDQQGRRAASQAAGGFEHKLASWHAYLLLKHGVGGPIVGVLGISLIIMSLSGLTVWTSYRRAFRLRLFPASLRRRDLLSAHRNLGVIIGVVVLYMGTLGTGLAFRDAIVGGPMGPGGKRPPMMMRPVAGKPLHVDWLRDFAALKQRFPDGTPNLLFFPKGPGGPLLVTLRHGEGYRRGYTRASVSAEGKVTVLRDSRAQPAVIRAYDNFHTLHSAEHSGPLYKALISVTGLMLALLGFTGGWSILSKLLGDVRGRERRGEAAPPGSSLRLLVKETRDMTARVKRIELVSADGAALPSFAAGAHIDVHLPNGLTRSYSLLNSPRERHRYLIGVLREQHSRGGSEWIHAGLAAGTEIVADGPTNDFPLDAAASEHLLIAGGIGITPLLSMATVLSEQHARFRLMYCTRTREDAAFADDIEDQFGDAVEFIHDGGVTERGLDLQALLAHRPEGAHLYVCGPRGLIDAARSASRHWPSSSVHVELFSAQRSGTAFVDGDAAFMVTLARDGRTLQVPANRSLLDTLTENGIQVKFVCREGVCGTCKTRVLAGAVDHRDECLTDEERGEWMEVCVSRAKSGERLVLDL